VLRVYDSVPKTLSTPLQTCKGLRFHLKISREIEFAHT